MRIVSGGFWWRSRNQRTVHERHSVQAKRWDEDHEKTRKQGRRQQQDCLSQCIYHQTSATIRDQDREGYFHHSANILSFSMLLWCFINSVLYRVDLKELWIRKQAEGGHRNEGLRYFSCYSRGLIIVLHSDDISTAEVTRRIRFVIQRTGEIAD